MADYTCKPNVGCYSKDSPSTHALFMELQGYLNRYAAGASFPLLKVDGILGVATVDAAAKVVKAVSQAGVSAQLVQAAQSLVRSTASPEALAADASNVLAFLKAGAGEIGLPPVAPPAALPKPPTPDGGGGGPLVVSAFGPIMPMSPAKKHVLTVIGAVLAAGAVVAVYKLATSKKEKVSEPVGFPSGPPPWKGDWKKIPGTQDYQASDGRIAKFSGAYSGIKSYKVYDGKKLVSTGGIIGMDNRHVGMN